MILQLYINFIGQQSSTDTRFHYSDVVTSSVACQITGVSIISSTVCSDTEQRKH